jgi:hypothetical protein
MFTAKIRTANNNNYFMSSTAAPYLKIESGEGLKCTHANDDYSLSDNFYTNTWHTLYLRVSDTGTNTQYSYIHKSANNNIKDSTNTLNSRISFTQSEVLVINGAEIKFMQMILIEGNVAFSEF